MSEKKRTTAVEQVCIRVIALVKYKGENVSITFTLTVLRNLAPARAAARSLPPPLAPPPLPPAGGGGGAAGTMPPGEGGGGAGGHAPEDGGMLGGGGGAGGVVGGIGGADAAMEACLSFSRRSLSCCSCL